MFRPTKSPLIGKQVRISKKSLYHPGDVGAVVSSVADTITGQAWYKVTFPTGPDREFAREQFTIVEP